MLVDDSLQAVDKLLQRLKLRCRSLCGAERVQSLLLQPTNISICLDCDQDALSSRETLTFSGRKVRGVTVTA